jgi:hypothetical protein
MSNGKRKRIIIGLFVVAILAFICGGVARILNQTTGAMWLDGIVGIMGGLYLSLLATSIIYGALTVPPGSSSGCVILWGLLCMPVLLLGLVLIFVGVSRLVASLP